MVRALVVRLEVPRQSEVVPDVELQRAAGYTGGIGGAIRLNLVGPAANQRGRGFEIPLGARELPDGDVAMAAVAIEFGLSGHRARPRLKIAIASW